MPNSSNERWQFGPRAAILAACAFSAFFGYFEGGAFLRAKLPFAGWFLPAFPLVCLLLPEGPDTRPEWPAEQRQKLQRSYTLLRVSFAWTMALACAALATASRTRQAILLIAISCCLGALAWGGRAFSATRKTLRPPKLSPVAQEKRAGIDFFEDGCPHCQAKLAIFPEDGDRLHCACGAVLKVERSGSGGQVSVVELP